MCGVCKCVDNRCPRPVQDSLLMGSVPRNRRQLEARGREEHVCVVAVRVARASDNCDVGKRNKTCDFDEGVWQPLACVRASAEACAGVIYFPK